jgi:hypothetical protein
VYFRVMLALNTWTLRRLQRAMKKRYPTRQLELPKR